MEEDVQGEGATTQEEDELADMNRALETGKGFDGGASISDDLV